MKKLTIILIFMGIVVGLVVQFIFPEILFFEALFNSYYSQQIQANHTGSIFATGLLLPIILALIGGFVGTVIAKLRKD